MNPQTIFLKDNTNQGWLPKLHRFSALLVVGTIPYPIKVHNLSVLLFLSISTLMLGFNLREFIKFCKAPLSILVILKLLILLFGLTFSESINRGFEDIERELYLLAVLLIIFFMKLGGINLRELGWSFSVGTLTLLLFGFFIGWISLNETDFILMLQEGHTAYSFFVGISQPLYLAVYLIFISLFVIGEFHSLLPRLSYSKVLLFLLSIIFLCFLVVFLRSKATLLLFPIFFIVYVVVTLKKRGWWVAFILLLISLLTFLIDNNSTPVIINDYGRTVSKAFDQRLLVWHGAIEGIRHVPIFGAGTGDAQALLNDGYTRIDYKEGIANNYNAHNQYLQFMARNGLIELLCFLAILTYSFWKSTKLSNYTFLMFNILVSLVMLTESFLSVQKGIVFFYFFLLAFVYLPEKKQDAPQI